MKTVAIIGASTDRRKFGNKAVRAFVRQGYRVLPINPHETLIEGLPAYASVLDVAGPIDLASFYVPPEVGASIIGQVAQKGIGEVWFNPGSESESLMAHAHALGLRPILACSIAGIGDSPWEY